MSRRRGAAGGKQGAARAQANGKMVRPKGQGEPGRDQAGASADFWGPEPDPEATRPPSRRVAPTPTATVVLDSLGEPPLASNRYTTRDVLGKVYQRSVALGTALAAAEGLLLESNESST